LETELPTDEISKRRIAFYERKGFRLLDPGYKQPPYHIGGVPIPMYLMLAGTLSPGDHLDRIKHILYKEVYHIEDGRNKD
jgi:hypothetical protein